MVFHTTYQISELDKIAYHALAISFSGGFVNAAQDYIGQPCIAACYFQGVLYLAANNVWRTQGPGVAFAHAEVPANVGNMNVINMVVNSLRAEGIAAPIRFIANPLGESDTSYHAELQLITFVYGMNQGQFDGNEIGVSKPCCQTCANELQDLGVAITDFHAGPTNAQYPGGLHLPFVFAQF